MLIFASRFLMYRDLELIKICGASFRNVDLRNRVNSCDKLEVQYILIT